MSALLAHAGQSSEPSLALSILALVGMIIPYFVFGYVSWIFWKAKKREDAARDASKLPWRNARSS